MFLLKGFYPPNTWICYNLIITLFFLRVNSRKSVMRSWKIDDNLELYSNPEKDRTVFWDFVDEI